MITVGSMVHQPWLAATGLHSPQASGRARDLQADRPLAAAVRAPAQAERAIAFGPFHLLPTRRLLLQAGKPVRLGSRALEILIALVERPGELVSKGEIMERVWPDTFVEEGNLIPTILITAHQDEEGRTRALNAGVICYLAKPFNEDDLLGCIHAALKHAKQDGNGS